MQLKTLLLLLCPVLFSSFSMCQIRFGVSGGINYANFYDVPELSTGATRTKLNCVVAGVMGEYIFSELISLRLESNYIQKGATFQSNLFDWTERVNYLEFPIGVTISPFRSIFKPYLYAGVGFAAFLNGRIKGTDKYGNNFDFHEVVYTSNDYTGQVGAGIEYLLNHDFLLLLDGRYSIGLKSISVNSGDNTKTNAISIKLGFLYSIN